MEANQATLENTIRVTKTNEKQTLETMNGYPYIDYFRIVAAILVIGIHISPFSNISEPLDFFVTRVIGRVAVPFFFMITGCFFFAVPRTWFQVKRMLLSLLQIYVIAIVIYLPINMYRGDFHGVSLTYILQDIFFNGTIYHLWYLPAAMMGIVITYLLITYVSPKQALFICIGLYIIGLGGDSYYNLVTQISVIREVYLWIFSWSNHTRNGIFMAPIFLYLGHLIPKYKIRKYSVLIPLITSFVLLFIEAIIIHYANLYRHDSMYIFLPIVVFFLIVWLLQYKGKRNIVAKDVSLYMYLIHPFIIVIVHSVSQFLGLQAIFFDNTLIQFVLVCILTIGVSYATYQIKIRGVQKWKKRMVG